LSYTEHNNVWAYYSCEFSKKYVVMLFYRPFGSIRDYTEGSYTDLIRACKIALIDHTWILYEHANHTKRLYTDLVWACKVVQIDHIWILLSVLIQDFRDDDFMYDYLYDHIWLYMKLKYDQIWSYKNQWLILLSDFSTWVSQVYFWNIL